MFEINFNSSFILSRYFGISAVSQNVRIGLHINVHVLIDWTSNFAVKSNSMIIVEWLRWIYTKRLDSVARSRIITISLGGKFVTFCQIVVISMCFNWNVQHLCSFSHIVCIKWYFNIDTFMEFLLKNNFFNLSFFPLLGEERTGNCGNSED